MPINWPDRYSPARAAAHVSNEITIAATPETVWAWLVRAPHWPDWYPNSSDVRLDSGAQTLGLHQSFTWRTFGVTVRSIVREYEPYTRIAWDGAGPLMDVYHAWLIEPSTSGTRVLTEESQNGIAPRVQALLMPKRMFNGHKLWLERLKAKAESGKPEGDLP